MGKIRKIVCGKVELFCIETDVMVSCLIGAVNPNTTEEIQKIDDNIAECRNSEK